MQYTPLQSSCAITFRTGVRTAAQISHYEIRQEVRRRRSLRRGGPTCTSPMTSRASRPYLSMYTNSCCGGPSATERRAVDPQNTCRDPPHRWRLSLPALMPRRNRPGKRWLVTGRTAPNRLPSDVRAHDADHRRPQLLVLPGAIVWDLANNAFWSRRSSSCTSGANSMAVPAVAHPTKTTVQFELTAHSTRPDSEHAQPRRCFSKGPPGWAPAGPRQVREGSGRTEESLRPREIGIVDRAEELVKPGQLEQALHGPWTAHDHEAPPAQPRSLVSLRQHA